MNNLPPHSYTIFSPWQPNSYFILPPLSNYPLTLTPFYRHWQPNSYIIKPPRNKLAPHSYTFLAAQLLAHFTPSRQITPSLLHHSPPLRQPDSYTILTPLAARLLHHFTPSEQFTPSLLHHFTPLAAQLLLRFNPSFKLPPQSYTILPPLAAQLLHH